MDVRLGLRRLIGRTPDVRLDVEEERYDDLRDIDGMIDLGEYAHLQHRQREVYSYIDLSSTLLDREAEERADVIDDLAG